MDLMTRIVNGSIPEPNTGCWLWLGRVYRSRRHEYGTFSLRNKRYSVHRAAFEAKNGQVPPGQICRHTCDVSLCVNPDHIIAGTQADNVADMFARHRSHQQNDPTVGLRAADSANDTMRQEPQRRARGTRHGMHGVPQRGEQNGESKLTTDAVRSIRALGAQRISQRKIARQFGVTQGVVWRIIHRRAWTHV